MDDETVANKLASNFYDISSDNSIELDIRNNRKTTVQNYLFDDISLNTGNVLLNKDLIILNQPFTRCEINKTLSKVNVKSTPGCDDIPFNLIKKSPDNIINFLLNLINTSFSTNVIPINWKTSIINPILKPNKDSNDINSYRPISLTTTISKIIEKMIVSRLSWFLDKNNLLNPAQAGFRKSFCTSDPIIRLTHEADIAINSENITIAILIDFSRAFDTLWIDGLLLKMLNFNIKGKILNWIKNYLSNRINKVKIGQHFSLDFISENGTPQGSSLSPLLFLIMVNDFPKLSQYTSDAFFADDCTIWRSGKNISHIVYHLQQDLDSISAWCKKWGFRMNTDKTMGIVFSKKKLDISSIKLQIDKKWIIFKKDCKMLGVILDNHMTWKPHVDYLLEKSTKSLNLMRCISGSAWGSNKDTLLILYKSIILSYLDYCCFTYADSSYSNIKRLDSIQYKALLLVTGGMKGTSLKALLGECAELPLKLRRNKIIVKYLLKIYHYSSNLSSLVLEDKKFYQIELNAKSKFKIILNKFFSDTKITIENQDILIRNSPIFDLREQVDLSFLKISTELKTENHEIQIRIINQL